MRHFVEKSLRARRRKAEEQIELSRHTLDEPRVHDLRVALRRYNEALRVFESIVGKDEARRLRHEWRTLRRAAGDVRDLDVVTLLHLESGASADSPLHRILVAQRELAAARLAALVAELPAAPGPVEAA